METATKWRALAEAKALSIRELMIEVTSPRLVRRHARSRWPSQIEKAVALRAADGFILVPHVTPGGLDEFADTVVPILQERDRFRSDYEGPTLRDHLGLPPARASAGRIGAGASVRMTTDRVPLGILDLVPGRARAPRRRRALRNSDRPGPDRRAPGLPPLLVRRAPPEPGRRRLLARPPDRHGGRRDGAHPPGFRRGAERPPDRPLRGRGVRPPRCHAPGPHRPGHRSLGRPQLLPGPPGSASKDTAGDRPPPEDRRTENGILIPAPPSLRGLAKAPRIAPDGRDAPAARTPSPPTTGS